MPALQAIIEVNDLINNALQEGEVSLDEVITLMASLYVMVEILATRRALEDGITKLEVKDNLKRLFDDRVYDCRRFMESRRG